MLASLQMLIWRMVGFYSVCIKGYLGFRVVVLLSIGGDPE